MTQLICIVCPKGCQLKVDENNDYIVTGYGCFRGRDYGYKELTNPTRVLTSTVKISGGNCNMLPVKTDMDIPKGKIMEVMRLLDNIEIKAPIKCGEIVIKNILGLNINIVATKNICSNN